jgi:hypothetical protein
MYIYQRMTRFDFESAFRRVRPDSFSNMALYTLFNWYEAIAEGNGEPYELDVIAECGIWAEYDAHDLIQQYGDPANDTEDGWQDEIQRIHDEGRVLILEVPQYDGYTFLVQEI